ncbi:IS21 family transposase (plasmid) [Streptomyces viridifaciens]|uniref:IS21 family transposase n=1 Tax=Streptomycetaceae TaxID=2062 RepID=UPI0009271BA5|nr:IS21 family transposase [Streptomyces viridifaciens]QEV01055.1 IS21 family transposase [Streptomyces viridifaciens]UKZ02584.1 IS21 family transposase [Streptomyces viridifaciens]
MIPVEDWAEIRRLHRAEEMPIRAIARHMGISKNTVKRALATDRPPVYQRPLKGSAVDAVEPAIRELLKQTPTMPATVIAERIGWQRGLTILKERVRELRPAYLPVDPVSRTVYQPGELAQCDLWFPAVDIPLGYGQSGRPPVLVIVCGYSRVITARMLPSRQTGDLIDGHWRLLTAWGAVPKTLVWDNEAGVGKGKLTSEFAAFAGLLAVRIHLCRPRDPEAKGLVERANGYLETSFLPGRTFTGPTDFNTQLTAWLQIANRRRHRSIDARPVDRWESDRAAMLTIPPVAPPNWWRFHTRIGRDHYIRVDTNDYSVHPRAIGKTVMVRADNEEITVIAGNDIVARHTRCWAKHQSLTDPEHAAAADLLRGEVIHQQAARVATARTALLAPDSLGIEVEQRELGTYDRMFTLIEGGAGREEGA